MIKREYKIRPSWKGKAGERGREITLQPDWCAYHKIQIGDTVTVIANGIMVILPPNTSKKREEEVRRFLEGKR